MIHLTPSSEARFPLRSDWERIQALPPWLPAGSLAAPEPDLVAFPLKCEWEAARGVVEEPYPASACTSRDNRPVILPSALAKLAEFAAGAGWGVIPQASMGRAPHGATGRPTALKRFIVLRIGGHLLTTAGAYVVYESPERSEEWKINSCMVWAPGMSPYPHLSAVQFKAFLADVALMPLAWMSNWTRDIEMARQGRAALVKRRAKVRAKIRKVADQGRFLAATQDARADFDRVDAEWRSKVADLQDGVFTSEEVAVMIDPSRKRAAGKEGMS